MSGAYYELPGHEQNRSGGPVEEATSEQKLRGLILSWRKLAKEWDDEERAKFDGPAVLYMYSTRVLVLMQCTDTLEALLAGPAEEQKK